MTLYKHVLVAVDLHPNSDRDIIERAIEIAKANGGTVSLVHAVEHINAYGVAEAYSAVLDVESQLMDDAKKEMAKLGQKFHIPPAHQHLEAGSPRTVILHKAKEADSDLIVVGSHGRHGLQLLLGSTANGVLHHAECDVLAVRVAD